MAIINRFGMAIATSTPLADPPQLIIGPNSLMEQGFNLPVTILTASGFVSPPVSAQLRSITIFAHVDTGASNTTIDSTLANHLGLIITGYQPSFNAEGLSAPKPTYSIDLSFPGTKLRPFINVPVGSCVLPFNLAKHQANFDNPNPLEFGLLIGRDIMSHWMIVWNGPTSTVFVAD